VDRNRGTAKEAQRVYRELLSLRVDRNRDCKEVRMSTGAKIAGINRKIESLEPMKKAIERVKDHCSGHPPAAECPILEILDSDEPLRSRRATRGGSYHGSRHALGWG
jgi:hypothetical protein